MSESFDRFSVDLNATGNDGRTVVAITYVASRSAGTVYKTVQLEAKDKELLDGSLDFQGEVLRHLEYKVGQKAKSISGFQYDGFAFGLNEMRSAILNGGTLERSVTA